MSSGVTRFLELILKYARYLAGLGIVWFIFSLVVTLDFLRQMDETVTPHDRAAITEAGVLAVLIGNDIVTLCFCSQFIVFHFFDFQVSASAKGSGHVEMQEPRQAAASAVAAMSSDGSTGVTIPDD